VRELIDKTVLRLILLRLESAAEADTELILVGGAAILVLVPHAEVTRDLDCLWTDGLQRLSRHLGDERWSALRKELHLSTRSDPFEVYLPPDWNDRARRSEGFSVGRLSVYTPAPEDLAVMKLFRFRAKDAQDIQRLAAADFEPAAFKAAFLATLPFAIGDPRWHAQSFAMLWNSLYPDSPVDADELLRAAGLQD